MREGWLALCQFDKFAIVGTLAWRAPAIPAALQHPESHHILEKARGPVHAAFICKVHLESLRIHDGRVEFHANKRPSSRTEECSAIASCDRSNGRTGVVARRSNNRCAVQ